MDPIGNRLTVYAYEDEELGRWLDRARATLARLPASSIERRQQEHAIHRLEHARLRHSINRAHAQLQRLPSCSHERRRLSDALDRMQREYHRVPGEIRSHLYESDVRGGPIEIVAEAREALQRAAFHLAHVTADADLREPIAEIERALARLKEYQRRTRAE